jgi:hypothetical protein
MATTLKQHHPNHLPIDFPDSVADSVVWLWCPPVEENSQEATLQSLVLQRR